MFNFVVVCLFYIEKTNEYYYANVVFVNKQEQLPMQNLIDTLLIINNVNNNGPYPYGAECVDIDTLLDSKGNVIWDVVTEDIYFNNILNPIEMKKEIDNE